MQLFHAICRYCGKVHKSKDDINNEKLYCKSCSKERKNFAKQAFCNRRVAIIADGKYILSKQYTGKN